MSRTTIAFRQGLILIMLHLIGCTAVTPLPVAGRAGDTITLALGSGEDVEMGNTRVRFEYDDASLAPLDLTNNIRSIFRLYPDRSSAVRFDGALVAQAFTTGHEAWMTVLALDLPATMPTGSGRFYVNSTGTYAYNLAPLETVPIAFEVLPGNGLPHPLQYAVNGATDIRTGSLADLQPLPQIQVRTSTDYASIAYGAVEFVINAPGAPLDVVLVPEDLGHATRSQAQSWLRRNGDDFHVSFMSATGLHHIDLRFALVSRIGSAFASPPQLVSTTYYDLNGDVISGTANPVLLVKQ